MDKDKPAGADGVVRLPACVEYAAHMDRLRSQLTDPRPSGDVDLYCLAMTLRGNADGSAEGTAMADELVLMYEVLQARVGRWDRSCGAGSDDALRLFFVAVLAETASFVATLRGGR